MISWTHSSILSFFDTTFCRGSSYRFGMHVPTHRFGLSCSEEIKNNLWTVKAVWLAPHLACVRVRTMAWSSWDCINPVITNLTTQLVIIASFIVRVFYSCTDVTLCNQWTKYEFENMHNYLKSLSLSMNMSSAIPQIPQILVEVWPRCLAPLRLTWRTSLPQFHSSTQPIYVCKSNS